MEVAPGLAGSEAKEIIDLTGYTCMPGVIDPHVHAGGTAQRLMIKAGVCTCLDMGAMRSIIQEMPERGTGMNVAGLQGIGPFPDRTPPASELEDLIEKALEGGAIGVKIAGGHRPSTPEATAAMIEAANKAGVYVAFHVGTTRHGSELDGLLEAIELAGKHHLHIAHVNSYLRGMIKDPVEEDFIALSALKGKKNLVSESYLGVINGTGAKVVDGLPQSHVTRNCLRMRGYEATEKGLEQAIGDGYGGSTPRNVAVESGLCLVRYQALTFQEFIYKMSIRGAEMLGLKDKGHLGIGADADITVLDMVRGKPVMAIVGGKV